VTDLAFAIAARMGLGNGQTQGLLTAAAIHDLGKVAIPSGILHKPGKLTATEFTLIKSHPEIGFEVLKNINFAWPVAEIVLQHHERLDGSGYPQGLRGGDILLEARILAVADVVEAMASHRPYRPAHGIDRALQEIAQNAGTLYDPAVVDACLQLFREGAFHFVD
jgi:HD-GYP domain-containing protein (c-di-GMP phosphodiesterase class II)